MPSSVDDLLKWDSLLYKNDILNSQSKRQVFRVHAPEKDSSDYGFGWRIYPDKELERVVYHTGNWAGNLSFIKRCVDHKSTIVILNNTYDATYLKEIRSQIEGYLKGKPLLIPKPKLAHLLQKESCSLTLANVSLWYEKIADKVESHPETPQPYPKLD